jgi:hypothetical protein
MDAAFYIVWNPDAGLPRFKHESEHDAVREAERLAGLNPGQRFYVLSAISVSEHKTVVTTRLEHELPF